MIVTDVVLLHPLGSDQSFFDLVVEELDEITCEAWNLPGHGGSPMLSSESDLADVANVVAARLRASASPPLVVGLSLGGLVALQLAVDHAELVAGLVVADAVPVYPQPMVKMWRDRAAIARSDGIGALVDPTAELWFTAELRASQDSRVDRMRSTFVATNPEAYARSCEVLATADVSDTIHRVSLPTTFVCGVDDAPAFVTGAEQMHKTVKDSRLVWVDDARHASAVEQPAAFASAVRTALSWSNSVRLDDS